MNKEASRDYEHKVFFYDHKKKKCKRVFQGQHFNKYSLDSPIAMFIGRYGTNLCIGSHPYI